MMTKIMRMNMDMMNKGRKASGRANGINQLVNTIKGRFKNPEDRAIFLKRIIGSAGGRAADKAVGIIDSKIKANKASNETQAQK